MGSLGSGNHFFEVDIDEEDRVWLVLHSGSRGIGNILGSEHIKTAAQLAKAAHIKLEDRDLAWLEEGTDTFAMYVNDMLLCQDYARVNRAVMLDHAFDAFREWLGRDVVVDRADQLPSQLRATRRTRRRAALGDPQGRDSGAWRDSSASSPARWATRPTSSAAAATPTRTTRARTAPGRQRSRGAAKRELNTRDLSRRMHGIAWMSDHAKALLDEHPSAYKDIDRVMAAQRDLVEPVHTLKQILNYKGL